MVCIKALMHAIPNGQTTSKRRRRDHSPEFKRQLVMRALEPGASVSALALEAGINANLLFAWRREYRDATVSAPALLLVNIEEPATPAADPPATRAPTGTIEIDLGRARVRLRGVVDDENLRCVLQTLHALA
jgi:transposase